MKIGIFTYNYPHRKTHDVIFRLRMIGYDNITLLLLPFVKRNYKPFIPHRPEPQIMAPVIQFINAFNIKACEYQSITQLEEFDKVLICGAGIIEGDVEKYKIINSHPGYLPDVRGLDAIKWAILEDLPIGVTTHFISKIPDAGILIKRSTIEPTPIDSFHSLAQKVYELEIKMLIYAITDTPDGRSLDDSSNDHPLNVRMTHEQELLMYLKFINSNK